MNVSDHNGKVSEGISLGLAGPNHGANGLGLGYGITFGPDGQISSSVSVNIIANAYDDGKSGSSGLFDKFEDAIGGIFGPTDQARRPI